MVTFADLIDEIHLEIFSYLNLNERAIIRAVSHRWLHLIDSILIEKLVMYQKIPPSKGKFNLDSDQWTSADTVYLISLNQFFASEQMLKCLSSLKKLSIIGFGYPAEIVDLKTTFNELVYLRLNAVHFTDATILKSKKLKTLELSEVKFDSKLDCLSRCSEAEKYLKAIKSLKSPIKKLCIKSYLAGSFFLKCFEKHLLDELEELEIYLTNFDIFNDLNKFPASLKKIDCFVGTNFDQLKMILMGQDLNFRTLENVASKLSSDLKVSLFGLPINRFPKQVTAFFMDFGSIITFDGFDFFFKIDGENIGELEVFYENDKVFDNFFKVVNTLHLDAELIDEQIANLILKKLVNVKAIEISFSKDYQMNCVQMSFQNIMNNFQYLIALKLFSENGRSYFGNKELDVLPNCSQIYALTIENYEQIDFNFLFKLKNIKYLKLLIRYRLNETLFIDLIRNLKYLALFEVYYVKSDDLTKEKLKSFKTEVGQILDKKAVFKITLHSKDDYQIVKYFYQKDYLMHDPSPRSEQELDLLFSMLEKTRSN